MTEKERQSQLDEILSTVKDIKTDLSGPPGKRDQGLVVRVDRLEQSQSQRSGSRGRSMGFFYGAAIVGVGVALDAFIARFTGGGAG